MLSDTIISIIFLVIAIIMLPRMKWQQLTSVNSLPGLNYEDFVNQKKLLTSQQKESIILTVREKGKR